MELTDKLEILADAAKYDASCASSGAPKRGSEGKDGLGATNGMGICHSYTPDGRCVSLLKILLTNFCIYDCQYCINRRSSNVPRARFAVEEVVKLTQDFYLRNYIDGLFLSSGIIRSADYTMEQLVAVARLHAMVKSVRREEHDMHAYIRFRERPIEAGAPRFVAWFEPRHDVLPQVAEHFVSRMGKVSWMIATPDASVLWDGKTLHNCGPLMSSAADLDDGGEALWLTYYRSIFNPARLNTSVMQSHIPSRFWKNLPEGALVPSLVSQAGLGARRIGQVQAVGRRSGATIPIAPEDAQPERQQPSKLDECRRCELWQHATQAVGGAGPKRAPIMIVGEQPGDQEDLAGAPFVGPAGKLLDQVFEQAGLDRKSVYLTNAVKHFKWEPRGKRRLHKTPVQREIEACHYWLEKELAACKPKVIVAMGATALKSVMQEKNVTLKDKLGRPVRHGDSWVVTIYHPSYVLRVPDEASRQEAFSVMVKGLRLAQELRDRPDVPEAPQ